MSLPSLAPKTNSSDHRLGGLSVIRLRARSFRANGFGPKQASVGWAKRSVPTCYLAVCVDADVGTALRAFAHPTLAASFHEQGAQMSDLKLAENNSLYKYVSIEGLRRILNGSVRFTQPGAFNDPFELLPELVIRKDYKHTSASINFDLLAERRTPLVGEVVDIHNDYVSSDLTSRNIVKDLNKIMGMFCVSKAPNSPLMWSHYADQYAGAVIEFDGSHDFFSGPIHIEYRKERQKKVLESYFLEPVPLAEICVKSLDWQYEGEVRIIRKLSDCIDSKILDQRGFPVFVQTLPKECIKTIAFGERTTVSNQRDIYGIIKDTDIGLPLSAVDNNGYTFRREIIKYSGPLSRKMGPTVSPRTAHIFSHLNSPLGEMARFMIEKHPASVIVNNIA